MQLFGMLTYTGVHIGRTYDSHPSIPYHSTMTGRMGNPRLPPYPHPTVVSPLAQIRQSTPFAGFTCSGGTRSPPTKTTKGSSSRTGNETVNVAAVFAPPRSWIIGSPGITKDKNGSISFKISLHVWNVLKYKICMVKKKIDVCEENGKEFLWVKIGDGRFSPPIS